MSVGSPRSRFRTPSGGESKPGSASSAFAGAAGTWNEAGSSASHASSSRLRGSLPPGQGSMSTSNGSGATAWAASSNPTYQPISLADALARARDDTTVALDEVLAERNKFCLEAAKLNSENMRIWNLMGRIRKENEALKARLQEAGPAERSSVIPRGSPLASGSIVSSASSPPAGLTSTPTQHPPRRRATDLDADEALLGASPSGSLLNAQGASLMMGPASTSPSSSTSGAPSSAVFSTSNRAGIAGTPDSSAMPDNSPPSSGAEVTTPIASSFSNANAGGSIGRTSTDTEGSGSQAHSSIMQQRAAIQARQRLVQTEGGLPLIGGSDARASLESHEFEAIDGSSVGQASPRPEGDDDDDGVDEVADVTLQDERLVDGKGSSKPDQESTASSFPPWQQPALPGPVSQLRRDSASVPPESVSRSQSEAVMPAAASILQQQRRPSHPLAGSPKGSISGLPPSSSLSQLNNKASSSSLDRIPQRPRGHSVVSKASSVASLNGVSAPRLDSALLRFVRLSVSGSNLRSNERGKEVISFFVDISLDAPAAMLPAPVKQQSQGSSPSTPSGGATLSLAGAPTTWKIEKLYSDMLALDARLKQKHGKSATKRMAGAQLPDKALFRDHAPSKVDQRKLIIEGYLQNLLAIDLPDKDDVCTFLCTDVVPPKTKDPNATSKEGFLTKKGQNMGRWVTRLYVLKGHSLDYYESRGGPHMGSINIAGAQIGRQQRSATSDMDENSYRHAFLVLEKRPGSAPGEQPQMVRHVLCAESDSERDEWVEVLVRAIADIDKQERQAARAKAKAAAAAAAGGTAPGTTPSAPSSSAPSSAPATTTAISTSSSGGPAEGSPARAGAPTRVEGGRTPQMGPTTLGTISGRRMAEQIAAAPPSPISSNFDLARPNSEGGRYPASGEQAAPMPANMVGIGRIPADLRSPTIKPRTTSHDMQQSGGNLEVGQTIHRSTTPDAANRSANVARPAISGPMNGTPIPSGYKFGGKEESAPAEAAKKDDKRRFWHRFGGNSSTSDKTSSGPRPVFGVPLAESIAVSSVSEGLELPSVVYRCIEYLEKRNAALEEGIYRLSGSSNVIKALKERFNVEGDVDLLSPNEPYYDPHAIAGLLKTFLRELPSSVLTRELHLDFMRVNDIVDRADRVNELGHLASMLPLPNYSLLRTLCGHLIRVIEHSDVNKMTMRNVGIVFSPTLGIPAGVFALFLTEFDWVFYTDARGEPAPRHMEAELEPPSPEELGVSDGQNQAGLGSGAGTIADQQQQQRSVESGTDALSGGELPVRSKKMNRSSWMVGNALHAGDGNVHQLRNNRNSLQYDQSEADKILGPRLGTHRLAEEDEGVMDEANDLGAAEESYYDATSPARVGYKDLAPNSAGPAPGGFNAEPPQSPITSGYTHPAGASLSSPVTRSFPRTPPRTSERA